MSLVSIAIVGNCQAKQIEALMRITSRNCARILPTKSVHLLTESDRDEFLEAVNSADYLITHPISDSFDIEYCRTGFLKSFFPRDVLQVSNIYTIAYNAQQSYLLDSQGKRLQGPLDGIHMSRVFESYLNGDSEHQAYVNYQSFSRRDARASIEASLGELSRRDHDFRIEIPISSLLESKLASSHLLHTFHHPTIELVWLVVRQIHNALGIAAPAYLNPLIVSDNVLMNNTIHVAPHPSSLEILGGDFDGCSLFRGFSRWNILPGQPKVEFLDNSIVQIQEIIQYFYRFYDDLRRAGMEPGNFICRSY